MKRPVLVVCMLSLLALLSITCSLVGGAVPAADATAESTRMQATVDLLQGTISAMEADGKATADAWMTQAAATGLPATPAAPQVPTEELLPGVVSGQLSYPSEGIPPLRLVLWNAEDGTYLTLETPQNIAGYRWENVPAGHYTLVAYPIDPNYANLAGGYTPAVACGLSVDCNDHNLIVFEVRPGEETGGIHPQDWYAPQGSFPADPTR